MLFIARNADFSENSIGTVTVPIEIQEETLSILENFSQAPAENVKNALNKFVFNIKQKGIYEKLHTLNLPCLASGVDEAVKNALTGQSCLVLRSDANVSATSSNLTIADKALKVVKDAPTVRLKFGSLSSSDCSLGVFVHDKGENIAGSTRSVILGNSTANFFGFMSVKVNVNAIVFNNPSAPFNAYDVAVKDNNFLGVSLKDGIGTAYFGEKEVYNTYNPSTVNMDAVNFGHYDSEVYGDNTTWGYMRQSLGMIYVADGLTREELSFFKDQVNKMMAVVYA